MLDSLPYHHPGAVPGGKTLAWSAQEIFGQASLLHESSSSQAVPSSRAEPQAVNIYILNGLLLALFMMYVAVVFRFRDSVVHLFKAVIGMIPMNAAIENGNMLFRLFIDTVNAMGTTAVAALLLALYISSGGVESYAPVAICAVLLGVYIYRKTVTAVIARLSTDRGFVYEAAFFDRVVFALATMVIAPIVMAAGFFSENIENIFWIILAIILIVTVLYYLVRNLKFFNSGKVSVLQWFLYLCAVEILPVSFFVLLLLKNYNN